MNSKERACDFKIRYKSEHHATIALKNQIKSGNVKLYENKVYKCGYCDSYHIGHRKVTESIAIKAFLFRKRFPSTLEKLK